MPGEYKPAVADKFCFFVVGTPENHFVGFLGDASNSVQNQIAYLKTLTLVRQIGDVQITNEVILAAIRELNAEAKFLLGSFPQVRRYVTLNPNTIQDCYAYGEDPALHIMRAGQTIKAFDLSRIQPAPCGRNSRGRSCGPPSAAWISALMSRPEAWAQLIKRFATKC